MAAVAVNAQSIRLYHNGSLLGDNDTVFVPLNGSSEEVIAYLAYENASDQDIDFRVRKDVLSINEETTEIYFCIGECYMGNLSQVVSLEPHQMVPVEDPNNFHTAYVGETDPAMVKYTFYSTDNESDKTSVVFKFGGSTSVRPVDLVKNLRAYPNPASNMVNIEYAAPAGDASLVIKNLTGKEVYRTTLNGTSGRKHVDLSGFTAGVYFYGIESDGKMLCTKKLLVK